MSGEATVSKIALVLQQTGDFTPLPPPQPPPLLKDVAPASHKGLGNP